MKIIKLLLFAAVIIGAVVLLISVMSSDKEEDAVEDITSAEAKEWKAKIDQLCDEDNWSEAGYRSIESGIHTDRETSKGELITLDEENALLKYLFTASCSDLYSRVDEFFKGSDYSASDLKSYENTVSFLDSKAGSFGSDSNLANASTMISEYRQLLGLLSFSSHASYSRPLRPFKVVSADAARDRINRMKYYKSHFSKNTSIRNRVASLASDRARAESEYYMNLEKAIENHYGSTRNSELLDDEIRFDEISTNSSARSRLSSFVERSK